MPVSGGRRPEETGAPNQNTIVARDVLRPTRQAQPARAGAPEGPSYQVLITDQVDPYDQPVSPEEARSFAPAGDNFGGTDRKAAKLSIPKAETETFSDLKDLIESLVPDDEMINHEPAITRKATSGRTQEEKRYVRVRAFLYAASREGDNDFHLIVGRTPQAAPMYMTMEISGLPPKKSAAFKRIERARNAYKEFFGEKLPGLSYHFYHPPVPVEIEGPLFFDITHAVGGHPGPQDLRDNIPTIWEVHPVTDIVFEP